MLPPAQLECPWFRDNRQIDKSTKQPYREDFSMPSPSPHPTQVLPVIMAGGSGTRLWPMSRAAYPKQFLVLSGQQSLFQQALKRVSDLQAPDIAIDLPLILGNEAHRFLILDQLQAMGTQPNAVVLEPSGRNTAPALTLAALRALEGGHDPVMVVTAADQTIADAPAFTRAVQRAVRVAATGAIAILGITPDRPDTGFGYIACTPAEPAAKVTQFVEKPDLATAEQYLRDGNYHWNSGMFVLKASVWLKALKKFRPDIESATQAAWQVRMGDAAFIRPGAAEFAQVPADSVDYAVMERCPGSAFDIRMVSLNAGWSDLGAWNSVWKHAEKDMQGNAQRGDVVLEGSHNTLVYATSRLVSVIGLRDVVVVETADAVMVTDHAHSQDVKKIVNTLEANKRSEHQLHRKVHRPWGWYDSIDSGPRFQVKRIVVNPGQTLSLQMHHHRAEHWIVVSGTAEVTCGDKKTLLTENQSTYIALGQTHRLANPGKVALEIIEVQSGSYLGEDDIVRFEDTYGRTTNS
jgi:mannose-1-phosphate guanylyltransferase / mannose-6-phosphate isomerase